MESHADSEIKRVSVKMIDPNPHRNFVVSRIDPERVARLKASYRENGNLGVLSARHKPGDTGRYQLAGGGHHRLAALDSLGVKKVAVRLVSFNSAEMLAALIDENAGQDKPRMDVVIEAVGAVSVSETVRILCSTKIENKSDRKALEHILKDGGVGEVVVARSLKGKFALSSVREAITSIKESDLAARYAERVSELVKRKFPKKDSLPRQRLKQMLANGLRKTPTLNSKAVLRCSTPSQSRKIRKTLKQRGVAFGDQVKVAEELKIGERLPTKKAKTADPGCLTSDALEKLKSTRTEFGLAVGKYRDLLTQCERLGLLSIPVEKILFAILKDVFRVVNPTAEVAR